ncbi:MAG: hypothetical protein R3B81_15450 [bacterium]
MNVSPRTLLAAALLISVPVGARAADWLVNADGSGDFPTIQAAFDAASPGDVILLGPGVYRDTHTRPLSDWHLEPTAATAIAFAAPGVSIRGVAGAENTILDGENAKHCLVGQDLGALEIEGITFLAGRTVGTFGLAAKGGAGVLLFRSQPTVRSCVFRECIAPGLQSDGAAGLYYVAGSNGQVLDNLFVDNYSGDIGGAIGILEHSGGLIEGNTFVGNSVGDGGGAIEANFSQLVLRRNIFAFNEAQGAGGAIVCLNGTQIDASCNVFWQNPSGDGQQVAGCDFLGSSDNVVANPRFCDVAAGDFTLAENSPAAGNLSSCGLIGALPIGCGTVSVEAETWGKLKALYR